MKHSVEEIVLRNGARGLLVDVPGATVMNFDFEFRAGHYLVQRKKWETPHIMEHMVLGANERFPSTKEFNSEFQKNGAYSNASTDVFSLHYVAECADIEWNRILDLLLLSISKPLFLASEFESEYGTVREEMIGRSNNNYRHLYQKLASTVGFVSMTDKDRIKLMSNVKLSDITAHFKKTHTSDNLRFVVAGNVKKRTKAIRAMLESIDLPRGERFAFPAQRIRRVEDVVYVRRTNVKNITFTLDFFDRIQPTREEEHALKLLDVLLGETELSLIFGKAREQGLAYYVNVGYSKGVDFLNWGISSEVSVEKSGRLMQLIREELDLILAGELDDHLIERAKQYSIGSFQISVQTVGRLASGYGGHYFFDESIRDYRAVPDEINSVSKEQIVSVVQKLMGTKLWALGALGNCGVAHARELRDSMQSLWHNGS